MKNYKYKIFVVNPGSTSTKVALFEDDNKVLETSVTHDAKILNSFPSINAQLEYRLDVIKAFIETNNIDLSDLDAIVGRGGSCYPVQSGTYEVNEKLIDDIRNAVGGIIHPSNLGVQLGKRIQDHFGGRLFMLDPICVDEYSDVARITGVKGIQRKAISHALNLRGTAMKHCKINMMNYKESNLVVAHIDGGITVAAHENGKMVDCNDGGGGEGPFTATRTGSLPLLGVLEYLETHTSDEMRMFCVGQGGFVSHFGTADADEIYRKANEGYPEEALIWEALGYNIVKYIGSMATVLKGKVDGIILTGRYTRFESLMQYIKDHVGWIAPVSIYDNEVEQEAMAAGALRVLSGREQPKKYKGLSV